MPEPVEVEACFSTEGQVRVLGFIWRGAKLPVTAHGRSWGADDGLHYLVMTPGDRAFELRYKPATGVWSVMRTPGELSASRLVG